MYIQIFIYIYLNTYRERQFFKINSLFCESIIMSNSENPFKLLSDLSRKPPMIPSSVVDQQLSKEDKTLLKTIGVTYNQLHGDILADAQVQWDRQSLYHQISRSTNHWLISCLRGDTVIRLSSGERISIKEMAENSDKYMGKYAWSVNPKTLSLEVDKIVAVQKTRLNAQLVRVYLDNGLHVDCTPDHLFMKRDGSYVEAQHLKSKDSLMPFYSKQSGSTVLKNYELVFDPKPSKTRNGCWRYAHRLITKQLIGLKGREGIITHHKDFNKLNNDPSNLIPMSNGYHMHFHGSMHKGVSLDIRHKEMCTCCICKSKRGDSPKGMFGQIPWNKGIQRTLRENRICAYKNCNTTFEVLVTNSKKYCSRKCANRDSTCEEQSRKISKTIKKQWENKDQNLRLEKIRTAHQYQRGVPQHLWIEAREAEEAVINHKVVKVEWLDEREDTYDISTEKNHNFALGIGIIVHNSALELYADYSTAFSSLHNSSVWVTSSSPTYARELNKLLQEIIGVEERIFDWAHTIGCFGNLFVKINALPGQGIVSVDDSAHPLDISRVDHEGILVGYYRTPMGQYTGESKLLTPWDYVHFRLLGAKKKRNPYGDEGTSEFRTMYLLSGTDTLQATTRYGTSLLINALPIYKRLKMAEDSLLLARLTRGILRYVWKLKVDSSNMEAVAELVDQYATLLKRARAIDTSEGSPNYDSKSNPMACLRGDTKIRLCNGKDVTIKGMAENSEEYIGKHVWSVNPDTLHIEPKEILAAQKTRRNAQLIRVYLDNAKYIDCTPDHRFMKRDGSYCTAEDLLPNDSLMPFYSKISEKGIKGYEYIYDAGDNKYHFAHWLATGPVKRGYIRHHKDYNKLNNDPLNFIICTREDHHSIYHPKHSSETIEKIRKNQVAWLKGLTKETCPFIARQAEKHSKKMRELHKTKEGRELRRRILATRIANGNLSSTLKGKDHPFYHKTWEEILGVEEATARKKAHRERMLGENNPAKRPEVGKKISNVKRKRSIEKKKARLMECLLNHKVVKVEWLSEKEDTYDITVKDNHNFSLSNGIFVHNSVEDIFIPVWGDTGDLTYDEIGGNADIRWIVDIEELRNQLACALRCPLSLLGGFVQEASGALGSSSIEKLDIRFARSSRRLQRSIKNGITRICQIHLAFMNMDPDANLFEVNMSETSTAEEESLRESLDAGVDTVQKMLDTLDPIGIDKVKVVNYLNQKLLKLEDFDINNFLETGEIKGKQVEEQVLKNMQPTIFNTDTLSYVPLSGKICEKKKMGWLGKQRNMEVWKAKFGKVQVREKMEKVGVKKTKKKKKSAKK